MTKFPLPAASTGEVTASADDLVVPVSHSVNEHPSRPSLLVPSVALAADASRLAAIHDKDMTPTPGSVTIECLDYGIVITGSTPYGVVDGKK